jgi:hypothetical protein
MWIFNASVSFGIVNTTIGTGPDQATQAYKLLTNDTYNAVQMESNFGGLGLAKVQWKNVT